MGDICIFIISWLPVLNPIATISLVPFYRNLVLRFLSTGSFSKSEKVHAVEVLVLSTDSVKGYKPCERFKDQMYKVKRVI
jgi:hypothetical protein